MKSLALIFLLALLVTSQEIVKRHPITAALSYDPVADGATHWLHADDSAFSGFTNGQNVDTWNERGSVAGTDGNFVHGVLTSPLYRTTGAGSRSLPYVEFAAGKGLSGGRTTNMVAPGGAGWGCLWVVRPQENGAGGGGWPDNHIWADGDDRFDLNMMGGNFFEMAGYNSGSVPYSSTFSIGTWYIVTSWGTNGTNTAFISVNKGTAVAGNMGSALSLHNVYIYNHAFDLAESICFNTNKGQTFMFGYSDAVNAKYGIY